VIIGTSVAEATMRPKVRVAGAGDPGLRLDHVRLRQVLRGRAARAGARELKAMACVWLSEFGTSVVAASVALLRWDSLGAVPLGILRLMPDRHAAARATQSV
jgi:hypothetical protein